MQVTIPRAEATATKKINIFQGEEKKNRQRKGNRG